MHQLRNSSSVIEMLVRNHPGVMSHITGLFSRRAFNLEAVVSVPVGDGSCNCTLILVRDVSSTRLEQIERQLGKLHDVLALRHRPDLDPPAFGGIATLLGMRSPLAVASPPE